MAVSEIRLKLVIDRKDQRVLFAEAGKDFVDFLFDVLSLPLAKVISLVQGPNESMLGSLSNMYRGLITMDRSYLELDQKKNNVLKAVCPAGLSIPLLGIKDNILNNIAVSNKLYYTCTASCAYNFVSDDPTATCPGCSQTFEQVLNYVGPRDKDTPVARPALLNGMKYMVMDDLVVKPIFEWTTSSWIATMKMFDVKHVSALEERLVTMTMHNAVKMLEASMDTKHVLTRVYLGRHI